MRFFTNFLFLVPWRYCYVCFTASYLFSFLSLHFGRDLVYCMFSWLLVRWSLLLRTQVCTSASDDAAFLHSSHKIPPLANAQGFSCYHRKPHTTDRHTSVPYGSKNRVHIFPVHQNTAAIITRTPSYVRLSGDGDKPLLKNPMNNAGIRMQKTMTRFVHAT